MRISQIRGGVNWNYAIGEFFLIVLGITVALAANSWYENQKNRHDELELLRQIQQTLNEDLQVLNNRWRTMRNVESDLAGLLIHLEDGRPYSDDLGPYFRSLSRFRTVYLQAAPFESLKARGLDLISNDSLRMKLISLYEDDFPRLQGATTFNRVFAQETATPYLMKNFRLLDSQNWVPNDYESIRSDPYLANLCRSRISSLRDFVFPYFNNTTKTIGEILVEIKKELD